MGSVAAPTAHAALELDADVLVIGGGPAGTWAASSAAAAGRSVVLADKGYCGSSGATAAAGTTVWYVDPDPAIRKRSMQQREAMGGYLADPHWMVRVLDRTYDAIHQLEEWQYPFPVDAAGAPQRISLQGPEYMRLMRKRVKQAGCKILDHSPALELLVDDTGAVAGAAGVQRQKGGTWLVRAKAVVIATGGCAFLSRALGCNVLTGDGHLMAAEIGADLSGMEFSNAYAISTDFGSVTKTAFYSWATFTYADNSVIPGAGSERGRSVIARTLQTQPVFAQIDRADAAERNAMRFAQPNFFLPFDRMGIDPFTQRFPVTLRLEGTVRGTGGLRIVDDSCGTSVPGLFAAGDAATRELICGAFTGGGSHNAAWAMSSGTWAGRGAAEHAAAVGTAVRPRHVRRAGGAGLALGRQSALDPTALIKQVQDEVFPTQKNYFRHADRLLASLERLDGLWRGVRDADAASAEQAVKTREAVAMLAMARWMYRSALARTETRGMHRREDHAQTDSAQHHYLTVGGLDEVWIARRPAPAQRVENIAA
jgi:succinate dehydrogenase/fumarate reductase flavoprotein subunit